MTANEPPRPEPDPVTVAQTDADEGVSLGDPRVDAAVSALRDLEQRDVDEHVEVYERAHEALKGALEDESQPSVSTPPGAQ